MKTRVFAYVEDNSKKGKPSVLLAIDEKEHAFKLKVDGGADCYEDEIAEGKTDSRAALAFAEFERVCTLECGLKNCNDEVIFARGRKIPPDTFADYVDFRLGCMKWAVVKHLEFEYRYETAHVRWMRDSSHTYLSHLEKTI